MHDGGQAIVYRATRAADGRPVVLKMLRGPYPTPAQQARFRKEYDLTQHLAGSGVVVVEGWVNASGLPIIVLEDFGAESLERVWPKSAPPVADGIRVAIAIVEALQRVHDARVLHLDVNPSNIIYCEATGVVKLIDFGLSTDLPRQSASLRADLVMQGTLRFVAPEQTGRMNRSVDYRSDFYSLGATLYWLFTGQAPFSSDDPLELVHAHIARKPAPLPGVPAALSRVVLKLLCKNAEDRYQSTFGILADLRQCAAMIAGEVDGEGFYPGSEDRPSNFRIPERLYGREGELTSLLDAFDRVASGGREVVLVQGRSGMGKTALVLELQRSLVARRGVFVAGKFEQFKRGVPYASLATALRQFVRQLLTGREGDVLRWGERLTAAVSPNGRLLIQMIPELQHFLGEQPALPALPPLEAEARLHRTVRLFMRELATAEHPLVLFMDDLQWADLPSISLLKVLATDAGGSHVLILGAYRDKEVSAGHPLHGLLQDLETEQVPVSTVVLGPLTHGDVQRLMSDTLHLPIDEVADLAHWCRDKTAGNPFFLHRFLQSLSPGGLLRFDTEAGGWTWDLERIRALQVTDNVVSFLTDSLSRFSPGEQRQLQAASILGADFGVAELSAASGLSVEEVLEELARPLHEGLIEEISAGGDGTDVHFRFLHDRIQQAAYEAATLDTRQRLHQQFGERLLLRTEEAELSDELFDIVNHLNLGLVAPEQSYRLASLNVAAGRRALTSSAYEPADHYLRAAREILGDSAWVDQPERMREVTLIAARTAYLRSDYGQMDSLIADATLHARDDLDRIRALRIRIDALIVRNKNAKALDVGLRALKLLDIELPSTPTEADIGAGLGATFARLEDVDLDGIPDQTPPEDPASLLAMEMLCVLAPPAYYVNQALLPLLGVELVRLTLEHGPTPESSYGFALLGLVLCDVGHIDQGYEFGRLSWRLACRFDNKRMRVRSGHVFNGFSRHWKEPAPDYLSEYDELYELAVDIGDFEYASYAGMMHTICGFYVSSDLRSLAPTAQRYAEMMQEANQVNGLAVHGMMYQAMLNLMRGADDPVVLTGAVFNEPEMLGVFLELNDPTCLFVFHCVKCVLAGYHGEWDQALDLAGVARTYMHGAAATPHKVALEQWEGLAAATLAATTEDTSKREALLQRAEDRLALLDLWASHNSMAHGHRPALIRAAIDSARGGPHALLALQEAADQARERGRTVDEAAALRCAGELCQRTGLRTAAKAYLIEAKFAFERWGGQSVVAALEGRYPSLLGNIAARGEHRSTASSIAGTGALDVDVSAVVRASQAVAKELDLDKLVETIVRLSVETSGATRCLVVSPLEAGLTITSMGVTEPLVSVTHCSTPLAGSGDGPEGIIQFVARTREELVLHDARVSELGASDSYIRASGVRSVLCLPIESHGHLLAVLCLEHRGLVGAFTQDRVALLRVLLAQAAISVENANLVDTLEEKVRARTQQLAAANEAKSDFLRSMSHELRTPLNGILGYSRLLLDQGQLQPGQLDAVGTIERSGRHLLSLINDILDMNKIEAGKLDLDLHPMRLTGFAAGVTKIFRPEAERKGLAMAVMSGPDLPEWIEADARRLRQILLNLVGNAVKFTGEGEVAVTIASAGQQRAHFVVRDTGPGIPSDRLEGIFDPFEQAGGFEQRAKGTGLGLTISRQIARQMGGDLTVESELGKGSVFTLEIPVKPCAALSDASLLPTPESAPGDASANYSEEKAPTESELGTLMELLAEGALSAIQQRVLDLAAVDSELKPFADRLSALARDFDDEGIERALAAAMEAGA
ncbi:MAG: AAA family ATPase [Proteobacteria bacterium]|nr:AAA family ATPase [Pseudomonadota bacterium]